MKGILFKSWKLKAIAESPLDREWQTRRLIKPQPEEYVCGDTLQPNIFYLDGDPSKHYKKPYHVGEVVYLKEAYQTFRKDSAEESKAKQKAIANIKTNDDILKFAELPYGHGEVAVLYALDFGDYAYDVDSDLKPWRSPLFMPAWAARYFAQITGVRAEQYHEANMTPADIEAEGGEQALKFLKDYEGKWVFVYCGKRGETPERKSDG